ncbi:hypothetical protein [Sphingomonas rubra]|uniref:Uncharacterized protein n=1 Tax=Sphingomonas rubra TaxID=634430 RepID=A0A1I5TVZ4_9SPHN|nr:hypothetical protein [Sphingomonas rubra]SFP87213.1 hypothetical protein SAMN04488241_109103 [Sphingomonas rubra]
MLSFLIAAVATPAAAVDPLRLETRILAERRVAAPDGSTRVELVPPARVGPGDPVVVEVAFRNGGAQPIGGLVIANPVPRGLAYRAPHGTEMPELSVDGRRFGPLASLVVALPGGGTRPATASDVTHVRWRLSTSLAAGRGGAFAFRAVVR